MVASVTLVWTVYWKQEAPAAMEHPFGPLPPDEEMPGVCVRAIDQSAYNLVENAGTRAGGGGARCGGSWSQPNSARHR